MNTKMGYATKRNGLIEYAVCKISEHIFNVELLSVTTTHNSPVMLRHVSWRIIELRVHVLRRPNDCGQWKGSVVIQMRCDGFAQEHATHCSFCCTKDNQD